jgi:transketolase
VVSIPSLETFAGAAVEERERILPEALPRLFVEAGTGLSFGPWMRPGDAFHGIRRFGASAPGAEVAARLGLNARDVAMRAKSLLSG